jgi:hypothetical protein
MRAIKNRKILQIFSDGSLNFCCGNFFFPKHIQLLFFEKDLKNFYIYNKKLYNHLNLNYGENLLYRKKYFNLKTNSKNL